MKQEPASLALAARTPLSARLSDWLELTRPRIAVMVLFTVALGALIANRTDPDLAKMVHAVLGTALVAAAASVLNQLLERQTDGLMRRTENRPLPAGRVQPGEALVLGSVLGLAGVIYLAATLRQPWTALIAALTLVAYLGIYTPLKRVSTLNTIVGAVPGALPPVIGWSAMTGDVTREAWVLFLILFLWQVPHFLAIAWIHREDYARAGLRMLPGVDPSGAATGRQMLLYCLTLVPVGLLPVSLGMAGRWYGLASVLLAAYFALAALRFVATPSTPTARRVLLASLAYLPLLFGAMLMDAWL